ncbi:hypothetical protein CRYUN_Cryun41cG0049200 [Craigia yunnanensis]
MSSHFSLINLHAHPTRIPHSPTENSLTPGGEEVFFSNRESEPETSRKKPKTESEYRKDREEWSETAIASLLEAYTEKFNQLNRGNLRGMDWEEVAEMVTERCGSSCSGSGGGRGERQKMWKSVEQCKNKIDNFKKRYKVELQRISGSGGSSHWHWFKQIEAIMGSNSSARGNNLKSNSLPSLKWWRVVFKISGTALSGNCQSIDTKVAMQIAREIATACRQGVEIAIVVGGRNFFCGDLWISATGLDRPTAYQIGMMATVMNSMLLQSALEKLGVQTRIQSAFVWPEVAEPYSRS